MSTFAKVLYFQAISASITVTRIGFERIRDFLFIGSTSSFEELSRMLQHQRDHKIKALEYERRRMRHYKASCAARLTKAEADFPQFARFRNILGNVIDDTGLNDWNDVDQDIAGLVRKLKLGAIPETYTRFMVLEEIVGFVHRVMRREGFDPMDPPDDLYFATADEVENTTIAECKRELRLN